FYKAAGFDVSIEQGQGSSTTVQTVATGVDNFGLADSATAALGISAQNVPVKIVSVYNQTGTMGLIYHPDSDFNGDLATLKGEGGHIERGLRRRQAARADVGERRDEARRREAAAGRYQCTRSVVPADSGRVPHRLCDRRSAARSRPPARREVCCLCEVRADRLR